MLHALSLVPDNAVTRLLAGIGAPDAAIALPTSGSVVAFDAAHRLTLPGKLPLGVFVACCKRLHI